MHAELIQAASRKIAMSKLIRQFHRWTSGVFVLSVIATTIALAQAEPVKWMSYVPLLPLAFLSLTGICMFAQSYASKWRRR